MLGLPFVGLEEEKNFVGLAKLDLANEHEGPVGIQDGRLSAIDRSSLEL